MHDDRHYNYWEGWFKNAFQVDGFTSMNTLWLSYFIAGGSISYKQQKHAFKKILQTVYTSLPDVIGVLFLGSKYYSDPNPRTVEGDVDSDDVNYCFDPISIYFEEIECKNKEPLLSVRGINQESRIFFSSRVLLVPFIEVRRAQQEDHDDLADVFNN